MSEKKDSELEIIQSDEKEIKVPEYRDSRKAEITSNLSNPDGDIPDFTTGNDESYSDSSDSESSESSE